MRISDWSSDVCSSDLGGHVLAGAAVIADAGRHHRGGIAWKARIGAAVRPGEGGMAGAGRQHAGGGLCGILVDLEQAAEQWAHHHQRHQHRYHRSEEHTSELQSLMRISYAVFCLKKKTRQTKQ